MRILVMRGWKLLPCRLNPCIIVGTSCVERVGRSMTVFEMVAFDFYTSKHVWHRRRREVQPVEPCPMRTHFTIQSSVHHLFTPKRRPHIRPIVKLQFPIRIRPVPSLSSFPPSPPRPIIQDAGATHALLSPQNVRVLGTSLVIHHAGLPAQPRAATLAVSQPHLISGGYHSDRKVVMS